MNHQSEIRCFLSLFIIGGISPYLKIDLILNKGFLGNSIKFMLSTENILSMLDITIKYLHFSFCNLNKTT